MTYHVEAMRSLALVSIVLFITWRLSQLIQSIHRANALSKLRRHAHLLGEHQENLQLTTGGVPPSTIDASLRSQHAAKLTRDALVSVLFLIILIQMCVSMQVTPIPHPPSDDHPAMQMVFGGYAGGGGGGDWEDGKHELLARRMWIPMVVGWIVGAVAVVQVIWYLIIEQISSLKSGDGGSYFESIAPGLYGRREGWAQWGDVTWDFVKFLLELVATVSIVSYAYQFDV